jgi:hypothetical protein
MGQLLREDEAGRTLIEVFEKSNTIASLTEMSEEAQRRLLGDLPPPKKRQKRSNPLVGSVYQFLKAARKNGETRRAAMSEDDEDDSSSSSSSEDDEDDEDEDTVRRKHFWRQVDVDDRYLYLAIILHRRYTIQPL